MERKIGKIFDFKKDWYQCVEGRCKDCHFSEKRFLCKQFITKDFCTHGIIFKKLEKVGEPYEFDGHIFQAYRTFEVPIFTENYATVRELGNNSKISIEIKQNKEDMEEKKPTYEELLHYYHSTVGLWAIDRSPQEVSLDWICDNAFQLGIDEKDSNSENIGKNLKPFDLQKAREGKPVCTRDGRKVRIICFDAKDTQPIIGLYEKNIDGIVREYLCSYHTDGRMYDDQDTGYDLMMLPEKKEGWVNIDKGGSGKITVSSPYSTKEEAIHNDNETTIDTIKISWGE